MQSTNKEYTPEEKHQIEYEKGFLMYLVKTKKAIVKNGTIKMVTGELYNEITATHKKILRLEYEDELLLVLEFIVQSQMILETIDQMDTNYYGNLVPVKTALEVVKKKLTAPVERDFKTVYDNGNKGEREVNETNEIIKELGHLVRNIATFRVPAKVIQSQMNRAYNFERDTMIATAHRIITKHEK
jgi:hypothetical protein